MSVVMTGENFNMVRAVGVFDVSSGLQLASASYAVNSPTVMNALVNLERGSYEFQVRGTTGTSNFSPTLVVTAPQQMSGNYFNFDPTTKRLTIDTQMMQLCIEGGAIVYIRDKSATEVLVDTASSTNLPTSKQYPLYDPREFMGFTSQASTGSQLYRQPRNDAVSFTIVSDQMARLTYSPLYREGHPQSETELVCDFLVDTESGEVMVTLRGTEADSRLTPFTIDLPIMNFSKSAVILGNGRKWKRSDTEGSDKTQTGNWYGPSVAVAEGNACVLAAWSECTRNLSGEYVKLLHKKDYDHMVLHTPQDAKQVPINSQVIIGGPWRIGTYKNWLTVAKRWRELYEKRTAAKPLWQNTCSWVRNIHATYLAYSNIPRDRLNTLAGLVPPTNLLYFIWNGNLIVLFGDHRYGNDNLAVPTAANLANIKSHGWRLMLYHPWVLFYGQPGANWRLQYFASKGWLPKGYVFTPDYLGPKDLSGFVAYWSDVDAVYNNLTKPNGGGGEGLRLVHPAASKFRDYLVQNYSGYCSFHNCDACYFDILGADKNGNFGTDRRVMHGQDYPLAEKDAIKLLNQKLPNLPVMAECLTTELIPYVFYTWQGYNYVGATVANHPLRTALIGSYVWSKEQDPRGISAFDDEKNALLGTLPQISLVGDYQVSKSIAYWSQARAKLFCNRELFNDLPPQRWDPQALAYYRSNNGNWVKFQKLSDGKYAYIEELPNGGNSILLTNSQ